MKPQKRNFLHCCVHDLTALLDMNQPAVSHQLSELKKRGIVNRRKEGRVVYYSTDSRELLELIRKGLDAN